MMESDSLTSSSPSKPWLQTRSGRLVIIVGLIGLFVLVFWMAMKSRQMMTVPPALVVDEQYLSLGEVWEDPEFTWTLPITNNRGQDVEIQSFLTSCSCVGIEMQSMIVPANQTVMLPLKLDLTKSRHDSESGLGVFETSIIPITTQGLGNSKGWVVHGFVHSPFAISPESVLFDTPLVQGFAWQAKTIRVTTLDRVEALNCECTARKAKVSVDRLSREPDVFQVTTVPREDFPAGVFQFDLRVSAKFPNGQTVARSVTVRGTIDKPVYAVPSVLALGNRQLGQSCEETIRLRSYDGKDFEVVAVDAGQGSVEIRPLPKTLESGSETASFLASCRIKNLGCQKTKLCFSVRRAGESRNTDVTVPIVYYGVQD